MEVQFGEEISEIFVNAFAFHIKSKIKRNGYFNKLISFST